MGHIKYGSLLIWAYLGASGYWLHGSGALISIFCLRCGNILLAHPPCPTTLSVTAQPIQATPMGSNHLTGLICLDISDRTMVGILRGPYITEPINTLLLESLRP